jgi:hypothetical protein
MSEDDVLFGYRLRVLDYASRASVSEACRPFGILGHHFGGAFRSEKTTTGHAIAKSPLAKSASMLPSLFS